MLFCIFFRENVMLSVIITLSHDVTKNVTLSPSPNGLLGYIGKWPYGSWGCNMGPNFFEGCGILFKIKMFIDPCNTGNTIKIYQ